jgi:hypothetical protein
MASGDPARRVEIIAHLDREINRATHYKNYLDHQVKRREFYFNEQVRARGPMHRALPTYKDKITSATERSIRAKALLDNLETEKKILQNDAALYPERFFNPILHTLEPHLKDRIMSLRTKPADSAAQANIFNNKMGLNRIRIERLDKHINNLAPAQNDQEQAEIERWNLLRGVAHNSFLDHSILEHYFNGGPNLLTSGPMQRYNEAKIPGAYKKTSKVFQNIEGTDQQRIDHANAIAGSLTQKLARIYKSQQHLNHILENPHKYQTTNHDVLTMKRIMNNQEQNMLHLKQHATNAAKAATDLQAALIVQPQANA